MPLWHGALWHGHEKFRERRCGGPRRRRIRTDQGARAAPQDL